MAVTACFQCRESGFSLSLGIWILYAATKSLHAETRDPTCHNEDQGSYMPQLRCVTAK